MQIKLCTKGNHEVEISRFRKNSKSKDGLQAWCKDCMNVYEKERWHNGDNERKTANNQKRIERNREYVKEYLQTNPCVDCGDSDWWALDFDHRDQATKSKEVCMIIRENGLDMLKTEIDKCDVRCVKCHRRRTIEQCGWWRIVDQVGIV